MADTTSFTTEETALIIEAYQKKMFSSLVKNRPLLDIFQRNQNRNGGGPFYKLPSTTEVLGPTKTGGHKFTFPARLDALGVTVEITTESQAVNAQQKDQAVRSEWSIAKFATPLAIYDWRLNMAQGDQAVVDYMHEQTNAALEDHLNDLVGATRLWKKTSTEGSLTGLPWAIHETTSSGVVGGLDRALHASWRNKVITTGAYRTTRGGIMALIDLMGQIAGSGGRVGLHLTNAAVYSMFAAEQYGQVNTPNMTDDVFYGYPVVYGAPVLSDPSLTATVAHGDVGDWYCIDLRYMQWYVMGWKNYGNRPAFCLTLPAKLLEKQFGSTFAVVTQGNLVFKKLNTHGLQIVDA